MGVEVWIFFHYLNKISDTSQAPLTPLAVAHQHALAGGVVLPAGFPGAPILPWDGLNQEMLESSLVPLAMVVAVSFPAI